MKTPEEIVTEVLRKHRIVKYQETFKKCMLDAMKEYSNQQNKELLEALLRVGNSNDLSTAQEYAREAIKNNTI